MSEHSSCVRSECAADLPAICLIVHAAMRVAWKLSAFQVLTDMGRRMRQEQLSAAN